VSVTVISTMFAGEVTHDPLHPDDGGGWHVGHVDWWEALAPFEGKVVRVTIELGEAEILRTCSDRGGGDDPVGFGPGDPGRIGYQR
jgi:hypothetical protein